MLDTEAGIVQATMTTRLANIAILLVKSTLLSGERKTRRSRQDDRFCKNCKRPNKSRAIKANTARNHTRLARVLS